jgi:hypothetical protein
LRRTEHRPITLAPTWPRSGGTTSGSAPHGAPVYDYEEPVAPDDPAARTLSNYLLPVLDTLGLHGPAHSEIMLTDRGRVLIESGARIAGSILPSPR